MRKHTLIIPLDFTDVSKIAVRYAIQLAHKGQVRLVFLHGYTPHYGPPIGMAMSTGSITSSMPQLPHATAIDQKKLANQTIKDFLGNFEQLSKLDYSTVIGLGETVDVICKTAADENADMILMGTQGAEEIEGFFVGTLSEKVSRKAPCPVMVVPKDVESYSLDTVCLAVDTNHLASSIDFDILEELLLVSQGKLHIIHISENGDKALKEHELKNHFKESFPHLEASFHVFYDDNPSEGITEFLDEYSVDLLVLVHREHGFFKRLFRPGVRKSMVFKSDRPLLILK